MREQPTYVIFTQKRKRALVLAVLILTTALVVVVVATQLYKPPYNPPPFETDAVAGRPEPPDNYGYSEINAAGNFRFGLASVMYQQENGSLRIYFTNPEENVAYLMCEVVDQEGKVLYKSGLLRPGEHLVSLNPVKKLENKAMRIEIKIYALDPEYYYSIGTVTLDNTLQPY